MFFIDSLILIICSIKSVQRPFKSIGVGNASILVCVFFGENQLSLPKLDGMLDFTCFFKGFVIESASREWPSTLQVLSSSVFLLESCFVWERARSAHFPDGVLGRHGND